MTKTYKQCLEELISIQAELEAAKRVEVPKAIAEVKRLMDEFGITPADLSFTSNIKGKAHKKRAVLAKYRGPKGESWSGRGLAPKWLKAELEHGKKKSDFLIKSGNL